MSGSYNKLERSLAAVLSAFPGVKRIIKRTYQWMNYTFNPKEKKWDSDFVLRAFEHGKKETFFGYYDKCPESPDGKYVLYHAVNPPSDQLPLPEEIAYIVVYDQEQDEVAMECSTTSFNWQQGARAMWIDNESLVFNDYDAVADRYVSRVISVKEKKVVRTFNIPVYDTHEKQAVGLNFDRLQLMRPDYGYRDRSLQISRDELDDKNDGIYCLDMETGKHKLFLSISQIFLYQPKITFKGADHWVNHLMISPNGEKLMFLHRWRRHGRVYHRLLVTSLSDPKLKVLADGLVSHCCWYGNDRIIAFLGEEGMPGNYYLIDMARDEKKLIADGTLNRYGDGHPSVYGDTMLFDTYPDRRRIKELMIMNLGDESPVRLGRFFEGMKFKGPSRCDLHPRWSRDGKTVYFDSVHTGRRRLYSLSIDE